MTVTEGEVIPLFRTRNLIRSFYAALGFYSDDDLLHKFRNFLELICTTLDVPFNGHIALKRLNLTVFALLGSRSLYRSTIAAVCLFFRFLLMTVCKISNFSKL